MFGGRLLKVPSSWLTSHWMVNLVWLPVPGWKGHSGRAPNFGRGDSLMEGIQWTPEKSLPGREVLPVRFLCSSNTSAFWTTLCSRSFHLRVRSVHQGHHGHRKWWGRGHRKWWGGHRKWWGGAPEVVGWAPEVVGVGAPAVPRKARAASNMPFLPETGFRDSLAWLFP